MGVLYMHIEEIEDFRSLLRGMVRELGMLSRKSSGTELSPLQSHILIELNKMPVGVTELANRLCVEKSSISRTLSGLVKAELLKREPVHQDGRASVFSLTHQGDEALENINRNANEFTAQAFNLISDTEKDKIYAAIHSLTTSLRNARQQRANEVVIRPITPEDNHAIAEVIRKSFFDNKIDHLEGVSLHDPELGRLSHVYDQPACGYWIAEINGQVIGGVGLAPLKGGDNGYCEMQKLYLDQSFTGMGIGRRLISLVLEKALAYGYKYCYLETLEELGKARSLYENFGFYLLDGRLGNTGHNSSNICMLKTLSDE